MGKGNYIGGSTVEYIPDYYSKVFARIQKTNKVMKNRKKEKENYKKSLKEFENRKSILIKGK